MRLPILVVEDDAETRRSLADYLSAHRHVTECCATLDEALAKLAATPYACVITNLALTARESREGLEIVRRARAMLPSVHLILITASADPEVSQIAAKAGADVVLRKPFALKRLNPWLPRELPET